MSLPKIVFVKEDQESNGRKYLSVEREPGALVENDDVVIVGEYVRKRTRKLRKIVEEVR